MKAASLWMVLAVAAPAAGSGADPVPLPPITVEGQRTLLDSRRPEFERLLPCLGCEAQREDIDSLAQRALAFILLPAEPPDHRDVTPLSVTARNPRADKLP